MTISELVAATVPEPAAPAPSPETVTPPPAADVAEQSPEQALPDLVDQRYAGEGRKQTGKTYAAAARKFLTFLASNGWKLDSMPIDATTRWLEPIQPIKLRRMKASCIKAVLQIARSAGFSVADQNFLRYEEPKAAKSKESRGVKMGQMPAEMPPVAPVADAVPTAPPSVAQRPGPPPPPAVYTQPPVNPKKTAGRVAIHRRATTEDVQRGIPAGHRMKIGDYHLDDVGSSNIENFIHKYIKPQFGPRPGGETTTYEVQRLDERGVPIYGQSWEVYVPAEAGVGGPGAAPSYGQQYAPGYSVAPPSNPSDRLITFLENQLTQVQAKITEMSGPKSGGSDAMVMMLFQQMQGLQAALLEAQSRRNEPGLHAPTATPALPLLPTESHPSAADEAIKALGAIAMRPQAAPVPAANSGSLDKLLELTIAKALNPPAPAPIDPLMSKLVELSLANLTKAPEKNSIKDQLESLKSVWETADMLRGGADSEPSLGHVLLSAIENADKIGEAAGKILAGARAPRLQQQAQAAQPRQLQLPAQARTALNAMIAATEDQPIADAVFGLVGALSADAEPHWKNLGGVILEAIKEVDSRPEIAALVTHVFRECGARKLATAATVEKISSVVHRHYTALYAGLTGGQMRVLSDAEPAPQAVAQAEEIEAEEIDDADDAEEEVGEDAEEPVTNHQGEGAEHTENQVRRGAETGAPSPAPKTAAVG